MKLFVVRHAEAQHNLFNLANDITSKPSKLTENGISQATLLAKKLSKHDFDVVFTSELIRTIDTARILVEDRGIELIADSRLNDIVTGMQGKSFSEYRDKLIVAADKWNFKTALGESPNEIGERVHNFLDFLTEQTYENVLVVTHGWVANCIYGLAHSLSNDEMFNRPVGNADIFEISI